MGLKADIYITLSICAFLLIGMSILYIIPHLYYDNSTNVVAKGIMPCNEWVEIFDIQNYEYKGDYNG